MLSSHERSAVMTSTLEYYEVEKSSGNRLGIGLHELKLESQYESQLVDQFIKYRVFDGTHPEKLSSLVNNDVVPQDIEESLLKTEELGHNELLTFVRDRFVVKEGKETPDVAFTATMTKTKAPTFANLFDVKNEQAGDSGDTMKANRKVLQRVAAAYHAGQPVDLKEICKSESLSVPLAIFNTDKTMRTGNKSELATQIRQEVGYERTLSLPPHPISESKHSHDGMNIVQKLCSFTKNMENFDDLFKAFRTKCYSYPSKFIDLHFERYERPTPKGQCQQKRKKGKGSNQPKKKFKRKAVEKVFTADTALPVNMEAFLSIPENKIRLQRELAEDILSNAPEDKVITVFGAFEDATEVRCSKDIDTEDLENDHTEADSRMILSKSPNVTRIVFVTEDTDFLVIALAQDFGDTKVYIQQKQSHQNSRTYVDLFTDVQEIITRLINKGIKRENILLLHALTGCDTVSFLYSIGKCTGWTTYIEYQVNRKIIFS